MIFEQVSLPYRFEAPRGSEQEKNVRLFGVFFFFFSWPFWGVKSGGQPALGWFKGWSFLCRRAQVPSDHFVGKPYAGGILKPSKPWFTVFTVSNLSIVMKGTRSYPSLSTGLPVFLGRAQTFRYIFLETCQVLLRWPVPLLSLRWSMWGEWRSTIQCRNHLRIMFSWCFFLQGRS